MQSQTNNPTNSPPPQIENIEILELAGSGGMSLVYKARQTMLDRIIAVKVISNNLVQEADYKRFLAEAKLTANLTHPNICQTMGSGISTDGHPYILLEFLEGHSLQDELQKQPTLTLRQFRDIFLPALSALSHAHNQGVIHRDIKPGNIMLCGSNGACDLVKFVDFGVAKILASETETSQHLTKTGALIGTPAYMSPEQCQGKSVDSRSDIYSMACVMYEALCGEAPFQGSSSLEVMHKHMTEAKPSAKEFAARANVPVKLATIICKALEKDPSARPQTIEEFSNDLNTVLQEISLDRLPGTAKGRSNSALPIAGALAGLAICMLLVIFGMRHKQPALESAAPTKNKAELLAQSNTLRIYDSDFQKQLPELKDRLRYYQLWLDNPTHKNLLDRASAKRSIAVCYATLNMLKEASAKYKSALADYNELDRSGKVAGMEKAAMFADISRLYSDLGDTGNELLYAKKSLDLFREFSGPNSDSTYTQLKQLVRINELRKNYREQEQPLKELIAVQEVLPDVMVNDQVWAQITMANNRLNLHRPEEAKKYIKRAESLLEENNINSNAGTKLWADVLHCYYEIGEYDKVIQLADNLNYGFDNDEKQRPDASCLMLKAKAYTAKNKLSDAHSAYKKALEYCKPGDNVYYATMILDFDICAKTHLESEKTAIANTLLNVVKSEDGAKNPAGVVNIFKCLLERCKDAAEIKKLASEALKEVTALPEGDDVNEFCKGEVKLARLCNEQGAGETSAALYEDAKKRMAKSGIDESKIK